MRKLLQICLLWIFCIQVARAQVHITGSVTDSTGKPITGANVTLVNHKGIILAFSITSSSGIYKLQHATAIPDSVRVAVSALGFSQRTLPVTQATQQIDLVLNRSRDVLPDVTVSAKPLLRRNGDTLNYDVSAFSDKQDRVIGDVIRKLPGVDVDEKGQISYGGKPINRFYIDNDNLLDGRYNIATRSIPTDMVAKVQVLENHQPTKVLKDMVFSDQAAINIVLSNKARLQMAGTGDVALGTPHVYNTTLNLLMFRKKTKFINYGKLNNTGNDLTDEINNFFDWDAAPPPSLMSASMAGLPDISKRRALFNNAGLVTTNTLFNLARDWQLRVNAHFLQDKQFQSNNYHSILYLPNDTIGYNEKLDSRRSLQAFNSQFTVTANREDLFLNNVTVVENIPETIQSALVATGNGNVHQRLTSTNTNVSNRFNLIKKIGKHSYEVFSLLNHVNNPSTLRVQPGLFDNLFNGGMPYAALKQTGSVPTFYTDNYVRFGIPGTTIKQQYRIGFNHQDQDLNSLLLREQLSGNMEMVADSFVNRLNWHRTRVYVQADYSYSTQKLLVSLSIPWQYQRTRYTGRQVDRDQHNFPFTPRMNLRYNTSRENHISLGYDYGNTWANINAVYDGYIMRNYRDFHSNGALMDQARSHNMNLSYNVRNSLKIFFLSMTANYTLIDRSTISQQQVSSFIQQATLIGFDNRSSVLSLSAAASKYVFPLMTTVGGKVRWNHMRTNQLQNGELMGLQNNTYTLSWNTQSKMGKWLSLGYNGSFASSRSALRDGTKGPVTPAIQRWLHSADASMTFGKYLTAKIVADNYTYLLPGAQDVRVTFADVLFTWYFEKIKSNVEFSLTNVMGTDTYSNIRLTANSLANSMYNIRPRMALVKVYFRF